MVDKKNRRKENVLNAYVDEDGYTMTTKGDFAITPEGQRALADKGLLDREKYLIKYCYRGK